MQRFLRPFSFSLMGVILLLLIAGSVVEHIYGTAFAAHYIYTAPWTIALWAAAAISGMVYICTTPMWRTQIITFLLHFSFVVILAGSLITHLWGVQGEVHLRNDQAVPVTAHGASVSLFLWDFQIVYGEDGQAPADYITELRMLDRSRQPLSIDEGTIRMNKPLKYHGFRFCQADYDSDGKGVVLTYSYDRWGTGVTYAGYGLLLLSIIAFFFQRGTRFRSLLQKQHKIVLYILPVVILALACVMTRVVTPKPPLQPVLQTPLLGIHVAVIMVAYTLFGLIMVNGIIGLCASSLREKIQTLSQVLLYPAIFCLTIGIFIGAIWANLSWGRYWGWDPKEVWALVTLLVYAGMLHWKPKATQTVAFHVCCILAFLFVLFTYFGVNAILGGLHAYK